MYRTYEWHMERRSPVEWVQLHRMSRVGALKQNEGRETDLAVLQPAKTGMWVERAVD